MAIRTSRLSPPPVRSIWVIRLQDRVLRPQSGQGMRRPPTIFHRAAPRHWRRAGRDPYLPRLTGRSRARGRNGNAGGCQPAMARAQVRACALSAMPGNRLRSSTAAANSPPWSKAARIAAAASSETTNKPGAWKPVAPRASESSAARRNDDAEAGPVRGGSAARGAWPTARPACSAGRGERRVAHASPASRPVRSMPVMHPVMVIVGTHQTEAHQTETRPDRPP